MSPTTRNPSTTIDALAERVSALEARIAALETQRSEPPATTRRSSGGGAGSFDVDSSSWTIPYEIVELEPADTWIELHEPSARPHLQRMIRAVVEGEGPVTERLALDRVRRAWGLKRAGGRVQEAFDQAVRQLVARTLVERDGDALRSPGTTLDRVRVPDASSDDTRRGAEDVPLAELALAMRRSLEAGSTGRDRADVDDLTMYVAKLMGWTRRGGAIQERLDAALKLGCTRGWLVAEGGVVRAGE